MEKAIFAGGCFWCMEYPFEQLEGIKDVISGYTGGHKKNPTYEEKIIGRGRVLCQGYVRPLIWRYLTRAFATILLHIFNPLINAYEIRYPVKGSEFPLDQSWNQHLFRTKMFGLLKEMWIQLLLDRFNELS